MLSKWGGKATREHKPYGWEKKEVSGKMHQLILCCTSENILRDRPYLQTDEISAQEFKGVVDNTEPLSVASHLPFYYIQVTTPLLFQSFTLSSICKCV